MSALLSCYNCICRTMEWRRWRSLQLLWTQDMPTAAAMRRVIAQARFFALMMDIFFEEVLGVLPPLWRESYRVGYAREFKNGMATSLSGGVVRNVCLYYPINFKFSNQLNVFPMSPVFVTTPFLVQKALKTANFEKCVFSCQTSKVVPEPPSSLVFRRKPAPGVRRAPANSSPLNSSPLVTALSPLAFWVQKCAKPGPVPELLLRRVFRGPTARRGPGSESDSPPRWSVSPPSLSPLKSPLHPAVFGAKKRSKRSSPKSPFFVSDCKWDARASKFAGFRWKAGSRQPLCSVFRFRAGKAANSSPPSMSPLVTASSPLSLGPKSAQWKSEFATSKLQGFGKPG